MSRLVRTSEIDAPRFWRRAGMLALCLVLAAGAYLTDRATTDLAAQNALVQSSHDTLATLARFLSDLAESSSDQRRYLITGNPAEKAAYDAAVRGVERDLDAIQGFAGDDRQEAADYRNLRVLAHQALARLDRSIALRQDTLGWFLRGKGALADPLPADAKALDRVQDAVAALQAAETRTLAQRQERVARALRHARLSAVLPALVAVALAVTMAYLLGRAETQRRRADVAWNRERESLLAEERSARQAAEAASRAKDEFLSTVSHELRTPLQGVMGWLEVLKRPQSSAEQRAQAIERIGHNARSQVRIVEDLLDAARMLAGKLKLRLGPADVPAVLESAADICRPAAQAKEIDLRFELAQPDLSLICDRDRLQQIVVNLLSNAVKFTPRGGHVTLALRCAASQIEIAVADSGIGIAPELLDRIFDRYVQGSTESTRRYGGVGLGLSIVRNLVELHGGTVTAASAGAGKGSTFVVLLPLGAGIAPPAARPALSAPAAAAPETAGPIAGLRILVVDDETDLRDLLSVLLAAEGARVDTAASAREASVRLEHAIYDVLVSDIGMPEEDGYTLLQRVRTAASWATPARVPAVALTAFAGNRDRSRALEAGFDAQLAKPVEIAELISILAWVAGRAGTPR